jgi:hypothetical protein
MTKIIFMGNELIRLMTFIFHIRLSVMIIIFITFIDFIFLRSTNISLNLKRFLLLMYFFSLPLNRITNFI